MQYQQVLDESKQLFTDAQHDISTYSTVYYYRALCHSQPEVVTQKLNANKQINSTALQAVKLYGEYMISPDNQYTTVIQQLNELLSNEMTSNDITLKLIAAQIYINHNEYKSALELLHNETENFESLSLQVQIYLSIYRVDLAEQKFAIMNSMDDDDILSLLCKCYINQYKGTNELVQSSLSEYTDLIDRYGANTISLNGSAVCHIQLKQYPTAVQLLKQSRQLSMTQINKPLPDTLINTIIAFTYMDKPDIITRVVAELQQYYPGHSYFTQQNQLKQQFDKSASNYAIQA